MDHQYKMLITILDKLRSEAPKSYSSYHPSKGDEDGLIKSSFLSVHTPSIESKVWLGGIFITT